MARVTPAAEAKRVLLQVDVAPGVPSCETDASRVEQVLVNLLGNAIKHAPEGSTVRLEVTARGPMVVYTLLDEGPGIEESELERIFDIYVSKDVGDTRSLGLGLPLSRRLARLLGGELRALARHECGGGCFVLELPASPGT